MKIKAIILFLITTGLNIKAQELERRPLLGIQMLTLDEDTRRVMQLPDVHGVLIKQVIPHSTAEKAGFQAGDVLLKLNETEVTSPDKAVKIVAACTSGSSFSYELIRDKKTLKGSSTIEAMPFEKHPGIEMIYTAAKTVNGLQRMIVSKPKDTKKHPVVVFIGGIGCYSLDFPLEPERNEVQLLNELTKEGYVCVRAEKPGVGDNGKCTPCAEVSFMNEMKGYVEMVRNLKQLTYVDSNQVYILGHSMGGVMAPLVSSQTPVKGIIAYGTIGSNFIEYLAKTRRTLAAAYKMDPVETDEYIKDYCECAAYYFVGGLSTEEAAKKKAGCAEYLSVFDLRSPAYNKELYTLNIPSLWKNFPGKALLLWGERDAVASREDHEIITQTVNYYHANNAKFAVIPEANHGMYVSSQNDETLGSGNGQYNKEVGVKIKAWLKSVG